MSVTRFSHYSVSKYALFGLFLALLICVSPVWAFDQDLFEANIVVDQNTDQAIQIRKALDTVLIKLTGRPNSLVDQRLSALRGDAEDYLVSFSYSEELLPDNQFGARETLLNAQFNERRLLAAMQRANIALWSLERPEVLLWLAIEGEDGERDMLAGDDRQHRFILERAAKRRGLPLILPVQDQTDYALIDANAIWGGFYENAEQASERYAIDRFVIAAASKRGDNWQVRWRLPDSEAGLISFVSSGLELSTALEQGIGIMANRIANSAMVQSSETASRSVRVLLQNIQNPAQFAAGIEAFKSMSQVDAVTLQKAQGNDIELALSLTASRTWLLQAIRLADELSVDAEQSGVDRARVIRINVSTR